MLRAMAPILPFCFSPSTLPPCAAQKHTYFFLLLTDLTFRLGQGVFKGKSTTSDGERRGCSLISDYGARQNKAFFLRRPFSAVQKALGRNEGPTAGIAEGFRSSEARSSTRKADHLLTVEEGN